MIPQEIIRKKRNKKNLTKEEIYFLLDGYEAPGRPHILYLAVQPQTPARVAHCNGCRGIANGAMREQEAAPSQMGISLRFSIFFRRL